MGRNRGNIEQLLSRFRASHFSLLVQRKVTKRKHTLRRGRATRGFVGTTGISGRGLLPLPETAHILVRLPSGFTGCPHRASRDQKNPRSEMPHARNMPLNRDFSGFDLLGRKASRAPQAGAAAEAPLFEHSEFGRRAASAEEHRAPMQLYRIGSRPDQRFWLLLPRQK